MGRVILGTTVSLDGFIQDRNGGMEGLYPDLAELRNAPVLQESMRNTGAVVMGKRSYELAQGDLTDYEYQCPLFIVTHHVPQTRAKGENERLRFVFVTEGTARAIAQAQAEAGTKDVTIVGGADIGRQCLQAGLVDELHIDIMPILLGAGLRLFEHLNIPETPLEKIKVTETGARTGLVFRILKEKSA